MILTQEMEEIRKHHYNSIFKLYDGTLSVLSDLKKQYKPALVSNCAVGLSKVIITLGLTIFFDCIILSYEVGVRKPDRRIYLKALNCLELKPHECIFVSDEISDLEGAREVGLRTMLVRQESQTIHEARNPNFKPDFQCNRISEIIDFL